MHHRTPGASRAVAIVAALSATLLLAAPVAAASPGELDGSFSGNGFRMFDLGGVTEPWEVLVEPGGGVTIAGEHRRTYYTNNERPRSFFIRLTAAGAPDTTFGTDGAVLVNVSSGNTNDTPTGWDRTAAGKYVVVGHLPGGNGYYVVRLNHDGTRDRSFGPAGLRTWTVQPNWYPVDVMALPDGRIVVLGGADDEMTLRAHLPDGSVDRSFGVDGESGFPGRSGIELLFDHPGRIIVAGLSKDRYVLRGFGLDGRPDKSFGYLGRAASPNLRPDGGYLDYGGATALDDGGFAVTGRLVFANVEPVYLVRFTESGELDGSFGGGDGWRTLDVPTSHSVAEFFGYDLIELPGGRLALAGSWNDPPYDDDSRFPTKIFVAAFNADGSRWRAFGQDGVFASNFGLRRENWYLGTMAVVGGKLVVAASVDRYATEQTHMVVARLGLD
jgi:uncharacterized delta-60 repeat protein